jgi:excisionase family DNA binding protein
MSVAERNYLTVQEIADDLGFASSTVRWWISSGYLRAEKVSGRYMVSRQTLKNFSPPHESRGEGDKPGKDS